MLISIRNYNYILLVIVKRSIVVKQLCPCVPELVFNNCRPYWRATSRGNDMKFRPGFFIRILVASAFGLVRADFPISNGFHRFELPTFLLASSSCGSRERLRSPCCSIAKVTEKKKTDFLVGTLSATVVFPITVVHWFLSDACTLATLSGTALFKISKLPFLCSTLDSTY